MGGWGLAAAAAAAGGGRGVGDGAGGAQTGGGAPLHRPSAGGKGAATLPRPWRRYLPSVQEGGGWGLGAGARAGLCRLSPPRRSDTASSDTGGDTPSSAPAPRTAAAVGTSGSSL